MAGGAYGVYVDGAGTLWVDTFHGLALLPKGAKQFQRPANLASAWGPLAESRGGTLWILDWTPSTQPKVRSAKSGVVLREFGKDARVYRMIGDQQGSLWVGTAGDGINRAQYPERADGKNIREMGGAADVFRQKDGLSGDTILAFLEDSEGDMWVATNGGLDRFRQTPLINVKVPGDALGFSLAPQEHGEVWVTSLAGKHNFLTIRNGRAVALKPLSTHQIHASYRDRNGVTFIGTEAGIMRYSSNKVDRIDLPGPATKSTEIFPYSMTMDGAGRLLALFTGRELSRLEKGLWTTIAIPDLPAPCSRTTLASDSAGRIWVGCTDNRVVLIEQDKLRIFTGKDGLNVGKVAVIQSRKERVWIGSAQGLQQFDGHRFVTVAPADGSSFQGVKGIVTTADNGVWFGEARGIIHIEEGEARRVESNPEYRVRYRAFDILDGLSDGLQSSYPLPNMVEGTDGRLWFATAQGVVWLDPKRLPTKPLPPQAAILSLTENGREHLLPALTKLSLPARTTSLQFAYSAGSLAIPERVRFRYKLDGQDKVWQDADTRREAFYTNLGPGTYRFHVMANNGYGWHAAQTTVAFLIQPAFFQTNWFYALCSIIGLGVLFELYHFRLGQISAQMQGRLEERLAERTRIARELHDTLLQSFQGLMLRLQVVDELLPPGEAKKRLQQSLERADQAIAEGRSAVENLRTRMAGGDLAEALRVAASEMLSDEGPKFRLVAEGAPRDLNPILRDEVYRIAREGLRNAFSHARACHIEIEIAYGERIFRLRIRDDGDGMPPDILKTGRSGHYGLGGMRERARQTGANLDIWSSAGKGTEIDLSFPGSIAYVHAPRRRRLRLFRKKVEE
jgi:signal transduction histidine kinase/ligand-binding sensor domain-containing protein